ncbi:MAG: tRNA uridine-5-carboxymethylaminomethyl(34) synthesis GTPase MnmE [Rikenellaceae bacterium]
MGSEGDIIVAPATLTGGAIAVVRLSGEGSITICDKVFKGRKGALNEAATHTLHYGDIVDDERVVDDVLVSVFRAPHSYTGEESIEISCHGSQYIVQEIITLLLQNGARSAEAGEFTTRAYLAGKMDLSQAEAVADMIASSSRAQHVMASTQMRGGYSSRLMELRGQLVELAALLELELDFSEEEVEFADRSRLTSLMESLEAEIEKLAESFALGNAIKKGVQVAIIGEPNVGKSTLLNALLGDQRAMVSDIAGTTRDLIEEEIVIDGITFRFIDTAGVHTTTDRLELMGIERTHSAIERAQVIIHLRDAQKAENATANIDLSTLRPEQKIIEVVNKIDALEECAKGSFRGEKNSAVVKISAKEKIGIEELLKALRSQIDTQALFEGAPIVSSLRHHELLNLAKKSLKAAQAAQKENLPTDLMCQDIREVLHHIGAITGSITTNDILGEIFSKFCIGK